MADTYQRQSIPTPALQTNSGYAEDRHKQIEAAVANPPPPMAWKGVRTGPEFEIEYEANVVQAMGLDESLLRKLSPFIMQIELPQVFANDGALTATTKGVNLTAYGAASRAASTPYESARDRLSQTAIAGMDYRTSSGQEYVTANSSGPNNKSTSTGDMVNTSGNTDGRLGQPAIADVYTAVDVATQLSAALNAPPLVFLLNPENVQISFNKIQQFNDRSRFGFIFQGWGEEQPRLAITAKCGAFIAGGKGLQFAAKHDSAAWQNLTSAMHFYRNNGYIHDTVGKSNAHHFIGALSIHYDQWVYYGHMESFNYGYDETLQHGGIEFQMEFVVSMMMDTHQAVAAVRPMMSPTPSLSDPRYSGMGSIGVNKPGEYVIGNGPDGTRVTLQGREVSGADGILALVPGEFTQLADQYEEYKSAQAGQQTQVTGTLGFQMGVSPAGIRSVAQGQARSFRRG